MNKTVKDVLIFTLGAAVGSVSTFLSVKKKFEKKADEEINEARELYEEKIYEMEHHRTTLNSELEGPKEIKEQGLKHPEDINRLNNKPDILGYTNYSSYFKGKNESVDESSVLLKDAAKEAKEDGLSEEELAEMEGPDDDKPYTDKEDLQETLSVEDFELINGEHKKALEENRDPYVIELSEYELTCSTYDKIDLNYYIYDDVLADGENDERVDRRRIVGDTIESSGFNSNDEDILYVRNDKLMSDFSITKIYGNITH